MSTDDDVNIIKAKQILQRIELRQLYSCVMETAPTKEEIKVYIVKKALFYVRMS